MGQEMSESGHGNDLGQLEHGQGSQHALGLPVDAQRRPFPVGENGRDESGRFALGNVGGPGRPPTATNYKAAFRAAVTPGRMQQIFDRLVEDALNGNTQAAAIVVAYGLGRPKEPIQAEEQGLSIRERLVKALQALQATQGITEPKQLPDYMI